MRHFSILAGIIFFAGCNNEPSPDSIVQDGETETTPEAGEKNVTELPRYTPIYRRCTINGAKVDLIQNRGNLLQYLNKNSVIAPTQELEHLTVVFRSTYSKEDGTLFYKDTASHDRFAAVMLIKNMTATVQFEILKAQKNPFVSVTYGELLKAAWASTSGNNTPQAFELCNDWIAKAFGNSGNEVNQETVILGTLITVKKSGLEMIITFTAVKT